MNGCQNRHMGYVLSSHQYGKAENHIVRIYRDTPHHEIRDITVTTALRGEFDDAYLTGEQGKTLPTDTQKNTAFVYAKSHGDGAVEDYAIALAKHFVDETEPVHGASVTLFVDEWTRAIVNGAPHDHTWTKSGPEQRTAQIVVDGKGEDQTVTVVGGIQDLVLLKSTGSEFHGFMKDGYTTLPETDDRILATALAAEWTFSTFPADWDAAYAAAKERIISTFATVHSLALQQTLWEAGKAVLDSVPELYEITLTAPNKHHFEYDFSRFTGEDVPENRNEVFHAADRPYGLIEATITRD